MLKRNMISTAGCLLLFAASLFTGCSGGGGGGSTPAPSQPVVDAATMSNETLSAVSLRATDIKVTINSPPVVTFKLLTAAGNPIKGLGIASTSTPTSLNYMRFTIAKLVPGTNNAPDQWVNYLVTATSRPTTENVAAGLVDNGDGSYTYTFAKNITDPTQTNGVTYQPTLTHRLAIQISGTIPGTAITLANPANIIYDFIPATGKAVSATDTQREITLIAKCNECHEKLAFHGGGRVETRYCVVCHTDQRKIGRTNSASTGGVFTGTTYIADGEVQGDFAIMVHKIHMGNRLTKTGYDYAGVKYNDIGYSMIDGQINCLKCHVKSDAAPQGDNWKAKPSRAACGSCHDNINFATGANSKAGGAVHIIQTSDANCSTCHTTANITEMHASENNTPNKTMLKAGLVNFTYEIKNVSVSTDNQPVVTFRILKDGAAISLPLTGFTGGPSFLVSYALPQDGITPVDYNNLGKSAAQPASVSLANLISGAQGTLTGPDASGYYTATINGASNAARFPVGATLRAVALQGYFTQAAGTNGIASATARHTISVVKAVTGDTVRRTVVDSAKCAKCHEWFEGHGGNRVYEMQVCVMCHNPNLSSSGRGANVANLSATEAAKLAAAGYSTTDPSGWPEASNNFKDLIHGIHAGSKRAADGAPYRFVRDRGTSGVYYYDWSKVTFPGILKNCESCHVAGTYSGTPANTLRSTQNTKDAGGLFTKTVPNTTDVMLPGFTSACITCHASANAGAHSVSMGGTTLTGQLRSATNAETCAACHSAGKTVDAATVHRR